MALANALSFLQSLVGATQSILRFEGFQRNVNKNSGEPLQQVQLQLHHHQLNEGVGHQGLHHKIHQPQIHRLNGLFSLRIPLSHI